MADFEINDTVDITDVVCPVTFVKAKVALEELEDGEILAIRMNDGEPVQNAPTKIEAEGHQIVQLNNNEDGTYTLSVKKVEDEQYEVMAVRVNADNFDELVLKEEKPVLVDFYSDTCIPCKMLAGTLGDVEEEYEDKIKIYKVNVNFDADLAGNYGIMAAPTLVLFDKGEEKGRLKGAVEKEEIVALFADFI